jgi:hypothetical protein
MHAKNYYVAAFIHVLTNVSDRFNEVTVFHVYVRFVCF